MPIRPSGATTCHHCWLSTFKVVCLYLQGESAEHSETGQLGIFDIIPYAPGHKRGVQGAIANCQ
jgi:hypothetical protein